MRTARSRTSGENLFDLSWLHLLRRWSLLRKVTELAVVRFYASEFIKASELTEFINEKGRVARKDADAFVKALFKAAGVEFNQASRADVTALNAWKGKAVKVPASELVASYLNTLLSVNTARMKVSPAKERAEKLQKIAGDSYLGIPLLEQRISSLSGELAEGDYTSVKDLSDALKALQAAVTALGSDLGAQIDALAASFQAALQEAVDGLEQDISSLAGALVEGDYSTVKALSDALKALETLTETLGSDLNDRIDALKEEFEAAIEGVVEDLEARIADLAGALADGDYATVKALSDALKLLESVVEGRGQELTTQVEQLQDDLQALVQSLQLPAPSIDAIAGNDVVNAQEATAGFFISGKGLPGLTVNLTFTSGRQLQGGNTAVVAEDGTWSVAVTAADVAALGEGGETVTATHILGGVPGMSASSQFIVDTAPNNAPSLLVTVGQDGVVKVTATDLDGDRINLTSPINGVVALQNGTETVLVVREQPSSVVSDLAVTDGKDVSVAEYTLIQGTGGNDTLNGSVTNGIYFGFGGDDLIRGGDGKDFIFGGNGNDKFVVLGEIASGFYSDPALAGLLSAAGLGAVVTAAELLAGRANSEVALGGHIDGGSGNDTLYIFGNVDLSQVTIDPSVENLGMFSEVRLTAAQLNNLETIELLGNTSHTIVIVDEAGQPLPALEQQQIFEAWLNQAGQQLFFTGTGPQTSLKIGGLELPSLQDISNWLYNGGVDDTFLGELVAEVEAGDLPAPSNILPIFDEVDSGTVEDDAASGNLGQSSGLSGVLVAFDADKDVLVFGVEGGVASDEAGFDIELAGLYGMLFLNSVTGAYEYRPDPDLVDALSKDDVETETFEFTVSDGGASPVSQTYTVQLTGANDAALITGEIAGAVTEAGGVSNAAAGTPVVSGQLAHSDVDSANDDNVFQAVTEPTASVQGYGTYTVSAAGAWSYTLDNDNASVQALNDGDTLTDTFVVQAEDGTEQVITVTINGANDAAVVSSADVSLSETDEELTTSGKLTSADVDNEDDAFVADEIVGAIGTFSIDASGNWTFSANSTFDSLNVGDSVEETFTVATVDGTPSTVKITITGTNDAAVITGDVVGEVTEAGGTANAEPGTPSASGQLQHADLDNEDNVFQAVTEPTASVQGYGTYTVSAAGAWSYTLDNDNASVQALNDGDTLTDTFVVQAEDGTEQVITVTINGANDAAVVSSADVSLSETDEELTTSGKLTSADVDNEDDAFVADEIVGAIGTFSIDASGNWTFSANSTFDSLNVGDSVEETFTVATVDGTPSTVKITITGTNDAAVITGGDIAGSATESTSAVEGTAGNAGTTASGKLNLVDVDNGDRFTAESIAGTYGTLVINAAGAWTYTIDNANTAVDALNIGDTLTDTMTVTSEDGTASQLITITIEGRNDAPRLTGGFVRTGENTYQFTVTDPDSTGLTYVLDGVRYSLDNGAATTATANSTSSVEQKTIVANDPQGGQLVVGNLITGTTQADYMDVPSNDLNSMMFGFGGDDKMRGSSGQDYLYGGAGNDVLWAGAGKDVMEGGTGVDTYIVVGNLVGASAQKVLEVNQAVNALMGNPGNPIVLDDSHEGDVEPGDRIILQANEDVHFFGTVDLTHISVEGLADGETYDAFSYSYLTLTIAQLYQMGTLTLVGDNPHTIVLVDEDGNPIADQRAAFETWLEQPGQQLYFTDTGPNTSLTIGVPDPEADMGEDGSTMDPQGISDWLEYGDGTKAFNQEASGAANNLPPPNPNFAPRWLEEVADGSVADTEESGVVGAVENLGGTLSADDREGAALVYGVQGGTSAGGLSTLTGAYGTLTVNELTGEYTYVPNPAAVDSVADGDTAQDSFVLTVSDGTNVSSQTYTITVTGANDAAAITGDLTATAAETNEALTLTGNLSVEDVDGADEFVAQEDVPGEYGVFSLSSAGNWIYVANAAYDELAVGESYEDEFVVEAADGTTQTVKVTITGTNDAPEITSAAQTGALTEDNATTTATGQVTAEDVDNGAELSFSGDADGTYGEFEVDAQTGEWTYTLDNSRAATQALAAGEEVTETFTVTVTDDEGATTTQDVVITITGTNDAPTATFSTPQNATEDGAVIEGQLTSTDADVLGKTAAYALVGDPVAGLVIESDGSWSFDPSDAAYQYLAEGEELDIEVTYSVTDDQGESGTASFTITVTGTNDDPVATFTEAQSADEDGETIEGQLTASDADILGETATFALVGAPIAGLTINEDGGWSFDPSDSAYQYLVEGQTLDIVVNYSVTDSQGAVGTASFTITLTGTNDIPVISGNTSGTAVESAFGTTGSNATGTLAIEDLDAGQSSFQAGTFNGLYGTLTLQAGGAWVYRINNNNPVVDALNVGDTLTDTISVKSVDGTATQQIVVTVQGSNDRAVIFGTFAGSVIEAGGSANATPGTPSVSELVTAFDVDDFDGFESDSFDGTYGTLTLASFGATGQWTYTLDNSLPAVQALSAGQVVTETFTVRTWEGTERVITITITGTNDDPVISGTADNAADAVTEDTDLTATGTLTSADIDNGATATWSIEGSATGTYGSLALNGNSGEWTYTLANGTDGTSSVVQNLAAGETVTDTFTVRVTDDQGGFDEQVVTITITGTNDDPVISGTADNAADAVTEDTDLTATGTLTSADIDNGATATWSIEGSATGTYGSLALNGNSGEWTYTLANGTDGTSSVVQNLAAGETVTDTFTVRVTDDQGGFDEQVVTITITGTNDDPVISGTADNAADAVTEDTDLTATGTLTSADIDNGATATWSIEGSATGTYGSLALNGNSGEWTYTLANGTDGTSSVVQNLAAGETVTDTFTVRVTDDQGGFDEQVVTITITGTNDDPVISGTADNAADAVTEDTDLTATGTLTSADIDNGATATWSIEGSATGTYGSLALNGNSGEWTYTLANGTDGTSSVVQNLAAGETVTDTFTVRVTDDQGGFDEQVVTITITGTNDDPVISGTADNAADAVTEDTDLTATGTLTSADIDNGATATWSIEGSATGTYGSLALNGNSGEWTYTLANGTDGTSSVVQNLAAGETVTDTFTVRVTDDQGGFDEQVVTITITGTNDDPVISGTADNAADAVTEDTDLTATGTLTSADIDNGATATWSIEGSATGTYGSLALNGNSGEWTYTLANGTDGTSSVVQNLAAGETVTDTFTVRVTDDQGGFDEQVVTITITGTNDDPVISGTADNAADAVTEDTDLTATGTLTSADIDNGATATWSIEGSATGTYGSLALNGNSGEWTYTLANAAANVQALTAGETVTDTFTVRVTDDQGGFDEQVVTITITGTNDDPVIQTGAFTGSVIELPAGSLVDQDSVLTSTGTFFITDADAGDEVTVSVLNNDDFAFGQLTAVVENQLDNGLGQIRWTFQIKDSEVDQLLGSATSTESRQHVFTVRVTDKDGGYIDRAVTITITGRDDEITVDGATIEATISEVPLSSSVTESGLTGQLALNIFPPPAGPLEFGVDGGTPDGDLVQLVGLYGTLTVNSVTGAYAYVRNIAAVEALDDGDEVTDSFTMLVIDGTTEYEQPITVTITGANDKPTLEAVLATIKEVSGSDETEDTNLTGFLLGDDVDTDDIVTYGIQGGVPAGPDEVKQEGEFGTLFVNKVTGEYRYEKKDSVIESLSGGQTKRDDFAITVFDGDETVQKNFRVELTGANDAPVVNSIGDEELTEQTDETPLTASVSVTFTDLDLTDVGHVATISAAEVTDGEDNDALTEEVLKGLVTPGAVTKLSGSSAGSVTLSFSAASSVFDYLADGDTVEITYTVEIDDGEALDNTGTQTFKVVITGTNDAPVIDAITQEDLTEQTDTAALTADIDVTFTDVDLTDVGHTASITAAVASGVTTGLDLDETALKALVTPGAVTKDSGDSDGSVTLSFSAASTAFDYLADGESLTITYTVEIDDGETERNTATQTFVVTITGTNDAPVIDAITQEDLTEQTDTAALTADIDVTFTDVDLTDVGHTASITAAVASGVTTGLDLDETALKALVTPGAVTKDSGDSDGSVTLSFSAASTAFDYLADGESLTITYTVEIDDGETERNTATQTFVVTITGTNDAPVIDAITQEDLTEQTDTAALTADIDVTFTDVDLTDVGHTASITAAVASGVTTGLDLDETALKALVTPGAVTKDSGDSDGSVTLSFSAASTAFDYLADGESLTITYTVEIDDGETERNTATQTFVVTITGTNDAPVIDAITQEDLTEQTDTAALTADIDVTFTDVDLTDVGHTVSITAAVASGVTTGLDLDETALKALVTPGAVTKDSGDSDGSVTLSFSAASTAFDYLADGESLTITYTVEIDDGETERNTATQTFVVTITGTNDAPVIDAITQEDLTEQTDTAALTADIDVTFTDVDLTDVGHTASITAAVASGVTTGLDLDETALKALVTPGAVTKDSGDSDGSVTLSFSAASTAFDYLADGESLTITYTVEIDDGETERNTATQTFVVTITGTNDAPVIDAITQEDLTEQTDTAALTADIDVTFTDVDLTDVGHTASITAAVASGVTTGLDLDETALKALVTPGAVTKDSGDSDGSVTLSFSAASTAFDYLADGESLTITYTVEIDDGETERNTATQTFVVTITGTNDAPVIDAITQEDLTEQTDTAALTADIDVTFTDVDLTDVGHTASITAAVASGVTTGLDLDETALKALVTPGAVTKDSGDSDGSVTLSFSAASTAFDYLADGESLTITYTVEIDDGETERNTATQTFVVTITGTNDDPVISLEGTDSSSATLTDTAAPDDLSATGTLTVTDVDLSDTVTVSVVDEDADIATTGPLGTLTKSDLADMFTLTSGDIDADAGDTSNITWTFDPAAGTFDYLKAGETLTITYTITADDGNGGTATQDVTITINGANDAPVARFITSTDGTFTIDASDPDDTVLKLAGNPTTLFDSPPGTPTSVVIDGVAADDALEETTYTVKSQTTPTSYRVVVEDPHGAQTVVLNDDGDEVVVSIGTSLNNVLGPVEDNQAGLYYGFNGPDTIIGGVNADTIYGGNGNDVIRGGLGADQIFGGAGDDKFVILGAITAADVLEYTTLGEAAVNALIATAGLTGVITYEELTTLRTESEGVAGQIISGGDGTDTLNVFGTADLSGVTVDDTVQNFNLFSTVFVTPSQLYYRDADGNLVARTITLFGNTPHAIVIVEEDPDGNPVIDENTGEPVPAENQQEIFETWLSQPGQQLFFENDGQPARENLALTVGTLSLQGAQEVANYLFQGGTPFTNELESELDKDEEGDTSLPKPAAPTALDALAEEDEDADLIQIFLTGSSKDQIGALTAFRIVTLPANGKLYKDAGLTEELEAGDLVDASNNEAFVWFVPDANWNGDTSFQFKAVEGTFESLPATANITVASVNDAPQGADKDVEISDDLPYEFAVADFGFTDPSDTPANSFASVVIVTLPDIGSLTLDGAAVTAGDSVTVEDITAGKLVYTPVANQASTPSFTFKVVDDGGTANGGVNTDATERTFSFTVETDFTPPPPAVTKPLFEPTTISLKVDGAGYGLYVKSGTGPDFTYTKLGDLLNSLQSTVNVPRDAILSGALVVKQNSGTTEIDTGYDIRIGTDTGNSLTAASAIRQTAVYGFNGVDTITGSAFDDIIFSGLGGDNLNGGLGADRFVFGTGNEWANRLASALETTGGLSSSTDTNAPATPYETITGFSIADGDWLDFTKFDFETATSALGTPGRQNGAVASTLNNEILNGVSIFQGSNAYVSGFSGVAAGDTVLILETTGNLAGDEGIIILKGVNAADLLAARDRTIITAPKLVYSGSTFTEDAARDGSISTEITIRLFGDHFTGNLTVGTDVLVTNLPAGLTASFVKTSDSLVTVTLTGNATAFTDVSNLGFAFQNSAFTGGSAAAISGASRSDLVVDFGSASLTYSATTFVEAAANDGTISTSVTITLAGDTFSDDVVTNDLVSASNVPAGLTANFVRTSATVITVTLTGAATANANADDVSNLGISFTEGAFNSFPADRVTGAVRNDLVIDFRDPNAAPVITAGPTFSETQITITANDPNGDTISLREGTSSLGNLSGGSSTSITLGSGSSGSSGSLNVWDGEDETDTGFILMRGTSGGNTGTSLTATSGSTSQWAIYGFAGNDSIVGSAQDDWLFGGAGTDTLVGGAGNDWIQGGAGNDSLTGGSGSDTFAFRATMSGSTSTVTSSDSYSGSSTRDTITDFSNTEDFIYLNISSVNAFNITGVTVSGSQYLAQANGSSGSSAAVRIDGFGSTNTAQAQARTILDLTGTTGNDTMTGGVNNDTLNGGNGNDLLTGGAGNDLLIGGAGNDTLIGGTGKDVLEGGSGSDVFRFAAGDANVTGTDGLLNFDVIRDYGTGDTIDHTGGSIVRMTDGTGGLTIGATGLVTGGASSLTEFVSKADDAATARAAALWSDGTDTYLFISDGTAGLGANDLLIQLVGINASSGFGLSGGDITTIS
jgi:VCBS repeat-containing protein